MNDIVVYEQQVLAAFRRQEPVRLTKDLDNGNMAILQIVDPDDVPAMAHWLRRRTGLIWRFFRSVEAAARVGMIVYHNAMRGREPKPPRSSRSRSKVKTGHGRPDHVKGVKP